MAPADLLPLFAYGWLVSCSTGTVESWLPLTSVMSDSSPHVRTSLEEIACTVSTAGWRSLRVRALGQLQGYSAATNSGFLKSVSEPDGPHCVPVDLRLLEAPPAAQLLEVFGEVHIADGRPYILAKFFSEASDVDAALYHRATELLTGRFPRLQR